MKNILKKYKRDIILIAALFFLALISFIIISLFKKEGETVIISADNETVFSGALSSEAVLLIEKNGESSICHTLYSGDIPDDAALIREKENFIKQYENCNLVVIRDRKVYVLYASCPDGICVNTGKVYCSGESITCLPNRVFITVR